MKSIFFTILLASSLLIINPTVQAQDNGTGFGAVIGSPDGLGYKVWVTEHAAVAGAISFSLSENNSSFYTHIDLLKHHTTENLNWDVGRLSFYYGGGVRFIWRDAGLDNNFWSLRAPTGINFGFKDAPVDFFAELAPTVGISPDFEFGFNGGLGFRYYLN